METNFSKKIDSIPDIIWRTGIFLFIIISTLLTYHGIGTHDFINFDDDLYVTKNQHVIQGITLDNIIWAFKPIKTDEKAYWHPITWLSHMLDCEMFGLNPGMHHMVSLSLHIINALLLFIIFSKMTGALWKSAFIAALFALHPINVESVAWIAERKNLLSTLFWMLTIIAYIYYTKRPGFLRYLLLLIMFTMGLMSKTILVTLPFVLLLLDYWPLKRFEVDRSVIRRLIAEKIPLLLIAAMAFGIVLVSLQHTGQIMPADKVSMGLRLSNIPLSYIKYISKTFWPTGLAVHYPFPDALPLWQPVCAAIILIVISILVVFRAKKEPYVFFGWFWFTGTLSPVSGIIQGGLWPEMALRWLYIPAIGLFIMLVWGWDKISSGLPSRYAINTVLAVIILALLSITSRKQLTYWQNSISIFKHTIQVTDRNPIAHLNLGTALAANGLIKKAIDQYNIVMQLNPNDSKVQTDLGNAYFRTGKLKKAIYHYRMAMQQRPDNVKALTDLANAYATAGYIDKAISHYTKALEIKPDNPKIHYNLGVMYYKNNRISEAIQHFQKALKLKPDYKLAENALNMLETPGHNR